MADEAADAAGAGGDAARVVEVAEADLGVAINVGLAKYTTHAAVAADIARGADVVDDAAAAGGVVGVVGELQVADQAADAGAAPDVLADVDVVDVELSIGV